MDTAGCMARNLCRNIGNNNGVIKTDCTRSWLVSWNFYDDIVFPFDKSLNFQESKRRFKKSDLEQMFNNYALNGNPGFCYGFGQDYSTHFVTRNSFLRAKME